MFSGLTQTLYKALRWSEAYTKTDMVYATRGGFWLIASKGVNMTASLMLATAMANLVPAAAFGIYKFVIAGAGIIGSISLLNIGPAITRSVALGFDGALTQGAREQVKWNLLTIAISFGVAIYYYLGDNNILTISFLIAGLFTPIINTSGLFSNFLAAKKDFRAFSIFEAIRTVSPSLILIVTVLLTENPILILFSYFCSTALVTFLLFKITLSKYQENDLVEPHTVSFGRHLGIMGFIGKLPEHVDKILIFHYLGAAQLALYTFALIPISHLKLLNDIPTRLVSPKLPARGLKELQATLPRKILVVVGVMLLIVMAYVITAPYIFTLLFPLYMSAVFPSQILALSLIFAPGTLFGEALTAHMRKKELYISQISIPLVRLLLFAVLVPLYGMWGAIGAIIGSQLLMFCLHGYLFIRAR